MKGSLPADLLARAPEEGARLVVRVELDRLRDTARRLGDPSDGDALHDARVAMRRVRGALRAYRDLLPRRRARRCRRALAALLRASSRARDAEVALATIAASSIADDAKSWIEARWTPRRLRLDRRVRARLARELPPLVAAMQPALERYRAVVGIAPAPRFGDAARRVIEREGARLERRLARMQESGRDGDAHAARLAAKRLRYLVDPLVDELVDARTLLARLTRIQDELGESRDRRMLAERVRRAAAHAPAAHHGALVALAAALEAPRA